MATANRTVSFYWIKRLFSNGEEELATDIDWDSRLHELSRKTWEEKDHGSIHYDAILDKDYPILTVLDAFDPAFIQIKNSKTKKIEDYTINSDEQELANSSVVAFFPEHSLVAYISSSAKRRTIKPIEACLNYFWSGGDAFAWILRAVTTTDSIDRFF
ncbi:hypothetical protein [Bifidobacterium magnum]|nr:hypothetical protein [Bifidobacterium magnum]